MKGHKHGLVSDLVRTQKATFVNDCINNAISMLSEHSYSPHAFLTKGICTVPLDGIRRRFLLAYYHTLSYWDLFQMKAVTFEKLAEIFPGLSDIPREIVNRICVMGILCVSKRLALYAPLIAQQERELRLFKRDELALIPPNIDYGSLKLSAEISQKLTQLKPTNIGMLKRLEGITPTAIIQILSEIRRIDPLTANQR